MTSQYLSLPNRTIQQAKDARFRAKLAEDECRWRNLARAFQEGTRPAVNKINKREKP